MGSANKAPKIAVLYHYYETDSSKVNLVYFLRNAFSKNADFYVNIAGGSELVLPMQDNLKISFTENDSFDFGGFSKILNDQMNVGDYDYLVFINSSSIGPFVPPYYPGDWFEAFTAKLDDDTAICGSTINILPPQSPYATQMAQKYGVTGAIPHVQTYCYAMTRAAVQALLKDGFWNVGHKWNKNDAILNYELQLSLEVMAKGWNITCIAPYYGEIDYRQPLQPINPSSVNGDPCFKNAFWGRSLDPYEVIFQKTNRNYLDVEFVRQKVAWMQNMRNDKGNAFFQASNLAAASIPSKWSGHRNLVQWLVGEIAPDTVVDLGVEQGFVAAAIAEVADPAKTRIYAMDAFAGPAGDRNFSNVLKGLQGAGISNVVVLQQDPVAATKRWDKKVGLLTFSGDQTFEQLEVLYQSWLPHLADNGVVLLFGTAIEASGAQHLRQIVDLPAVECRVSGGAAIITNDRNMLERVRVVHECLIAK